MAAMEKNNKTLNVPHLRFPEFSGEWEICKVSDILDFYSTNSLAWEQLEYGEYELKNLHYGLIHNGLSTCLDTKDAILPVIKQNCIPKNYTECQNGDVAFADASEDTNDVAKCVEFTDCHADKVVCGLHTIHGRDKGDKTVVGFKGYAFSSQAFRYQIRRLAQGTKIYSISSKNFSECNIGIPSKEEQTKIATLLKLIEQRILTQKKIIEDLKKLKDAITHSHYRNELSHSPMAYIGQYLTQVSKRNKAARIDRVLSVSNKYGFINQDEQFEDREVASADTSNYKDVHKGDFAYNPARINVGSVARLQEFENGIVSPMYVCFTAKKGLLPAYFELYLSTNIFKHEMNKRLEGSVRLCLTYESLCNIKIALPEFNVQKDFVSKVSTILTKIKREEKLLVLYHNYKQYLLSQMFI